MDITFGAKGQGPTHEFRWNENKNEARCGSFYLSLSVKRPAQTETPVTMEPFLGKWKFITSEKFDDYMAVLGKRTNACLPDANPLLLPSLPLPSPQPLTYSL